MIHTTDMMICCSFAKKAGNFGMGFHNAAAEKLGLDFLYKSFAVDDIGKAIAAMRTLKFRGAAVSMPYKIEVLKHVDRITESVQSIGASNTIVNDGSLVAYNTDWLAAQKMLDITRARTGLKELVILGNGGYAKAVAYAASTVLMPVTNITRCNWSSLNSIHEKIVFNCTPVEGVKVDSSNAFVDCVVGTETGNKLALWQAQVQFELFTGHHVAVDD